MRRFFLAHSIELDNRFAIEGQDARHIGQVLRLSVGDSIEIAGSCGQIGTAVIEKVELNKVTVHVTSLKAGGAEPPVSLILAQGLPKADKMDFIVQKAVELGVTSIIPMAAEQSVVRYDAKKAAARVERWQAIAREAAKQAKRDIVPTVLPIQGLKQVLSGCSPGTVIVMLYEGQTPVSFRSLLSDCAADSFLLLIGPEGGFSSDEVELCRQVGAQIVTLGPRILRTETASLAAISIIQYEYGDLGGLSCRG